MIALLLISSLLLCLTGCDSGTDRKNIQDARAAMEAYLSARGGTWSIGSIWADKLRPSADTIISTGFVYGEYTLDGVKYDFSVESATDEIYTSEHMQEFLDCVKALVLGRLNLDTEDCVVGCGRGSYSFREGNAGYGHQGGTLPTDIPNMEAYAEQAMTDETVGVLVYLACRGVDLRRTPWQEETFADWKEVQLRLCALPAPDAQLPADSELSLSYWNSFSGDRMELTDEGLVYLLPEEI